MHGALRWVVPGVAIAAAVACAVFVVPRWTCTPEPAARAPGAGEEEGTSDGGAAPVAEPGASPAPGHRSGTPAERDAGGTPADGAGDAGSAPSGTGALAGMVLDAENLPAVGAIVTVRLPEPELPWEGRRPPATPPDAGLATVRVDEDGFFRIAHLPAGTLTVEAAGAGYVRQVQEGIDVPAVGEAWVEFHLDSGLAIAGRVTDERGAPLAGAAVMAFRRGGAAPEWATTLRDGSYAVAGLRPGEYHVRASAGGFVDAERDGVRAGTTGVDFRLGQAAAIAGRVIWRGAGSPIAGADVRAEPAGLRRGRGFGGPGGRAHTRTGDDGRFVLEDLDPGSYVVRATAADRAPGAAPPVTLAAGQRVEGLVIELGDGARVSGVVLTDPDRRPVEGATVSISPNGASAQQQRFRRTMGRLGLGRPPGGDTGTAASATTDARGRFELLHVPSGAQTVVAAHEGFPEAQAAIQVPEDGEVAGLELTLPAGGAIAGTVTDSRGGDRAGSSVIVANLVSGGMAPSAAAQVDATGKYRIDGLVPGRYRVMMLRPPSGGRARGPGGFDMSVPQETTVRVGDTAIVDFQLDAGVTVHGVVRQGGQPAPQASVEFSPEGESFGGRASSESGDDGQYTVDGLAPGRYVVRVEHTPLRVDVPDVDDFELNLDIPTGAVAGRVLDAANGAPVPDARVTVLRADVADPAAGAPWGSSFAGAGRTAPDGTFEVSGLAEGAYEVQVSHPDYAPGKAAAEIVAGGRHDGLELRLAPGARLAGKVVDAQDAPVADALVLLSDPQSGTPVRGDMRGRRSAADGSFEASGLSPGSYAVQALAPGYAPSPVQVADTAGNTPLVLRVTGGGRLEATVADAAGQPVAGAQVEVLDPTTGRAALPSMPFGFSGRPPVTDGAGRVVYEHVPAGTYALRVAGAPGPGPVVPVEVRESETTTTALTAP